jgi:hypothetical protein
VLDAVVLVQLVVRVVEVRVGGTIVGNPEPLPVPPDEENDIIVVDVVESCDMVIVVEEIFLHVVGMLVVPVLVLLQVLVIVSVLSIV